MPSDGYSLGMPSYNATTGKRVSGAAQRKRKRARNTAEEDVLPHLDVSAPPLAEGVEDCISWANDVGLHCIATARHGGPSKLLRVRVVSTTLAKLGMLKDKALRSEQAVKLRNQLDTIQCDLLSTEPPLGDAVAAVAWAYFQLVQLLYEQCHSEITEETLHRWEVLSSSIARLGYVKEQSHTLQLAQRFQTEKKVHSVELTHVGALCSSSAASIH